MPNATLSSILVPQSFDSVIEIAKTMSTDKESPSLNAGRSLGSLLRKVCASKYCVALRGN